MLEATRNDTTLQVAPESGIPALTPYFDTSEPLGGPGPMKDLEECVQNAIHNLEGAERRWDARLERVEEEIHSLIQQHEALCRDVWDSGRVGVRFIFYGVRALTANGSHVQQQNTVTRVAQIETEVTDFGDAMAALTRSVGATVLEIKGTSALSCHGRKLSNYPSRASPRAVHEVQTKIGRMDLDFTVMRSQRNVDRVRTERIEHGIVVLEAADACLARSVKRLERDIEDLNEVPFLTLDTGAGPDTASSSNGRTLAAELADTCWDEESAADTPVNTFPLPQDTGTSASCFIGGETPLLSDAESIPLCQMGTNTAHVPGGDLSALVSGGANKLSRDGPVSSVVDNRPIWYKSSGSGLFASPPVTTMPAQPPDNPDSDLAEAAGICVCSSCRICTYYDKNHVPHRGVRKSAKTIKRHKLADKALSRKKEIQQEVLGNAILLATVGEVVAHRSSAEAASSKLSPEAQDVPAPAPTAQLDGDHGIEGSSGDHSDLTCNEDIKARRDLLSTLQSGLHHRLRLVPSDIPLVFMVKPTSLYDPMPPLDPSTHTSLSFIEVEEWIVTTRQYLAGLKEVQDREVDILSALLLGKLYDERQRLIDIRRRRWDTEKIAAGLYQLESHTETGPIIFDPGFGRYPLYQFLPLTERLYASCVTLEPFVLAALLMTCLLHAVHSVNRLDSRYVLATLRVVLFGVFMFCNKARRSLVSSGQRAVMNSIPTDVRTALKRLHIDPEIIRYACCPRCFKTYRPDLSRPDDPYPRHCDHSETDKPHICNLTRPWPTRTAEEHRRIAREWLEAPSEGERKAIFEEHGIRWSELLRLPYWDPMRFPVVDAMHCLFLGDLRHHCQDVWGIDVKDQASSQTIDPHSPDEQRLWLGRVVTALHKKSHSALSKIRKGYLATVAQVNGVVPESHLTKKDYVSALLKWAECNSVDSLTLPPVLEEETTDFHLAEGPYDISKFRVLTQDVVDVIRADIKNIVLPSWIERLPSNFGSVAHGKLKADQWRVVCTVSLTVTLVRLWGTASASQKDRLLLDNFVHLVTAVDLATRRSMTRERALAFDHHMLLYLQGLREIFSHDLVPNHHLSLHLVTCLLMFRPVHGWWAFPFERYNGLLQSINTNNLPDDIPLTFMRGFYSGAELRRLMASTQWPGEEVYNDMVAAFHAAFSDAVRGTLVSDIVALDDNQGSNEVTYDVGKQACPSQLAHIAPETPTYMSQSIRALALVKSPRSTCIPGSKTKHA
ncbi:hypothetical protein C8Q79DRAFT_926401 [Trametes meyenii]|nr:hypothetical protein C8Q79DRAFT_926401 [Trametes meyenii]